jgi:hypothetical protein
MKFGILAQFKNEAMAMEEWIEHYFWQGADLLILLDNNSTDGGAEIAKKHANVIVIDAPKKCAQVENYFSLGYTCAIKQDVDYLAVLDLDEFMFGQDGKPLKQHLEQYFDQGYSQLSVNWTMFGSSGYELQPKSIRKSFLWRKKHLQSNLKSVFKTKDLVHLKTHRLLLDLLENRPSFPIPSKVERYWGIMEHNPFDWKDRIAFLSISLPICLVLLCGLKGFPLRVLSAALVVQACMLQNGNDSNQIERNRSFGRACFTILAILSLFKT